MEKGSEVRKAEYEIDNLFLDRWSPRAMSGAQISDDELMRLFEAARWAPSNGNSQPWRFVYAKREDEVWNKFYDLLDSFNKKWCKNSAVLVCLLAYEKTKDGKKNENAFSDSGAAWENLALQATKMGLVCHGMGGFDKVETRKKLKVPKDYGVVHMIAIGKPGELKDIPERMRKSEKPNDRKQVREFAFNGVFNNAKE